LFSKYWQNLKLKPGATNILGGNCSTHAAEAFKSASIISSGIPGLDTPDNVYKQIKSLYLKKVHIYSGNVGANPLPGKSYELVVE